jgi:hypothetical protein
MSQTPKDVALFLEPLVDAVSNLVLAAATGQMDDVLPSCTAISMYTVKLIGLGKDAAESVWDREHALAIIDAINATTHNVENLVSSFEALSRTASPQDKLKFSDAAAAIGDSLDQLVVQTDRTPEVKMKVRGNDAVQACKDLVAAAKASNQQNLIDTARAHAVAAADCHKMCASISPDMRDPTKGRMITELAAKIKSLGPAVVQHAQAVFGKSNVDASGLDNAAAAYIAAIERAQQAAKQPPRGASNWSKLADTVDFIKKLVAMAKAMNDAADRLYQAAKSGNVEDFIAAARAAAEQALALVKAAEDVANRHPDPVFGQMIRDAANDIRKESGNLIRVAKVAQANPNDPKNIADLSQSHKDLSKAVRNLVYLVSGERDANQSLADKLYGQDTRTLEGLARAVVASASAGDKPGLDKNKAGMGTAARTYLDDARALADETSDPRQRQHIQEHGDLVYRLAGELGDAATNVVPNPNDGHKKAVMQEKFDALLNALNKMKEGAPVEVVAIAVERAATPPPQEPGMDFGLDMGNSTDDLVKAARAQAEAAQQLARDAMKIAAQMKDQNKRKQLEDAVRGMLDDAQALIRAAEAAAANPNNKALYDALLAAQNRLADSMANVMSLTGAADSELQAAMAALQAAQEAEARIMADFFRECDGLIETCEKFLKTPTSDVQSSVQGVKEVCSRGMSTQTAMRAFANHTQAPDFKRQLNSSAGLIKDRSLQLKIIGMVKAAAQDENARKNQLDPAVRGTRDEAVDIVKTANGQVLKYRVAMAQRQLQAMQKAIANWRAKHALFN